METFFTIMQYISSYIIHSLPPLLFTIIIIEAVWKNRFRTKEVLNWIRWSIIACSIIKLILFLNTFIEESIATDSSTGIYKAITWFILLLPFILFYKKLASRPLYLLLIAMLMNIGRYFEVFVIIMSSFHRDYAPIAATSNWGIFFMYAVITLVLNGLILALILLVIAELKHRMLTARKSE